MPCLSIIRDIALFQILIRSHTVRIAGLSCFLLLIVGCNLTSQLNLPESTTSPTLPPLPTSPPPLPTEVDSNTEGWETIAPGLEYRSLTPNGNFLARLDMVRIDPARYSFRAHYRPGDPLSLSQWQSELIDAAVMINANFFNADHTILGLLVADGIAYGQSYINRGGTFAILNGLPLLRSNITTPYQGEAFEQAVQAFPMLIESGEIVYAASLNENSSRRSAIGIDRAGRVLLIATPLLGLSLADLAAVLDTEEPDLIQAMNLDGGGSTMLAVTPAEYAIASLDPVPAVLAVYPAASIP
jgi:uncharacterized protein YigE (DUF2233 family)